MIEKLIKIIFNEVNKHKIEKSCLLASYMFNPCVPNSEIIKGYLIGEDYYFYMYGLNTITKYTILVMNRI